MPLPAVFCILKKDFGKRSCLLENRKEKNIDKTKIPIGKLEKDERWKKKYYLEIGKRKTLILKVPIGK